MDIIEISRALPDLTLEELKQIEEASLEKSFFLHKITKEDLFIPKEESLYLIVEGIALVCAYTDEDLEFNLEFGPGECVGQLGAFHQENMDFILRGMDSCTIVDIPIQEAMSRTNIHSLVNIYQRMLTAITQNLLKVLKNYGAKVNFSNEQYFLNFLISKGGSYTITSIEDLAQLLHIEMRTLQRVIKRIIDKKIIQKTNKTIEIIDMEAAERIVRF